MQENEEGASRLGYWEKETRRLATALAKSEANREEWSQTVALNMREAGDTIVQLKAEVARLKSALDAAVRRVERLLEEPKPLTRPSHE